MFVGFLKQRNIKKGVAEKPATPLIYCPIGRRKEKKRGPGLEMYQNLEKLLEETPHDRFKF